LASKSACLIAFLPDCRIASKMAFMFASPQTILPIRADLQIAARPPQTPQAWTPLYFGRTQHRGRIVYREYEEKTLRNSLLAGCAPPPAELPDCHSAILLAI
jgi:hypothetical protein